MDFYIIPTLYDMELMHKGDRYFCLAHLYNTNTAYREFFRWQKRLGKFITLDNGAAEHSLVTNEVLLACIRDLKPNEVILPDTLFDCDKTFLNAVNFLKILEEEFPIQMPLAYRPGIFVVPQGDTESSWKQCFTKLFELFVNYRAQIVFGFSKIAVPKCFGKWDDNGFQWDQQIAESRQIAIDWATQYVDNHEHKSHVAFHCLGAGDVREFEHYVDNSYVRSFDSCIAVWSALCNIELPSELRPKTPHDYFLQKLSSPQKELALKNIEVIKNICHKKHENSF